MAITSEVLEERLSQHDYRVVRRTEDHSIYEHHGDRVVVPHHSHELSPWTARVIEWSLEPRLGRAWLTAPPCTPAPPASRGTRSSRPPLGLTLVIRAEPDHAAWNAFVLEEPRILTFGATLAETRRRAADAAGAWFVDTVEVEVELQPLLQLDTEAQWWVDYATNPNRSPTRVAEAHGHLSLLGLAREDITELLDPPPNDDEGQ